MKSGKLHIFVRIMAVLLIILISNYLYTKTLWPKDVSSYADLQDSLNKYQDSTDILYLTSSSNYFHPGSDTNSWFISEWIQRSLPDERVHAIQKGYMHAGVFSTILENLDTQSPVHTLIIEMNLRSFGAFWVFSNVETNYSMQALMMNQNYPPLLRRAMLSFGAYDNRTDAERKKQFVGWWKTQELKFPYPFEYKYVTDWDKGLANSGRYLKEDGKWDYDQIGFACNIVKAFAFHIDTVNHPRIEDFDRIVEIANERQLKLIFVIVPEDVEKAGKMVGKEIPWLLNESANLLFNRYNRGNVKVVNCLNLLDASYYYEAFPTEHYRSAGKKLVSEQILQALKK